MVFNILTANRLKDGLVVWFGKDHAWQEDFEQALIAKDDASLQILQKALLEAPAQNLVVDVNIIDIDEHDNKATPKRLRERIRQSGPTIAYAPNNTIPKHLLTHLENK